MIVEIMLGALILLQLVGLTWRRVAQPPVQVENQVLDGFSTRIADLEAQVRGLKTTADELGSRIELRYGSLNQLILRRSRASKADEQAELAEAVLQSLGDTADQQQVRVVLAPQSQPQPQPQPGTRRILRKA